ncbi:hypothetical protein ABVK25_003451 [Lepraria finkii]|uniref:Uncharacterized protein n=1 Tax=Lepraria finkii TaxID=1340010 RepID=A0ABR4BF03_9LECA
MELRHLEGYGILWETFHKPEDGSDMFDEILGRVRHLKLLIVHDISKTVGLAEMHRQCGNCTQFIGKAITLQTLHLSFTMEPRRLSTWLSELTNVREHWPSLKDLKPDLICTEQSIVGDFHSTHAPTLRSLELKDITLHSDSKDNNLSQES